MKFVFKAIDETTNVEVSFEAIQLDEIYEMYKQFLRGAGFYFEDDTE